MEHRQETVRGPLTIRPIRVEDAPAFRDLRLDAFKHHPAIFYGASYAERLVEPLSYWQAQVQRGLDGRTGMIFVAATDATLIGTLALERDDTLQFRHNARIWHVYVRAGWRGLGLADALIDSCMAWAQQEGIRMLRLSVAANNGTAIRCYTRHGFTVYGVEQEIGYYQGAYIDELLMARRLSPDERVSRRQDEG
jgi:ribosomal protein S18 acetylase RimI-like enzyme